jgi:hypothetical protein
VCAGRNAARLDLGGVGQVKGGRRDGEHAEEECSEERRVEGRGLTERKTARAVGCRKDKQINAEERGSVHAFGALPKHKEDALAMRALIGCSHASKVWLHIWLACG